MLDKFKDIKDRMLWKEAALLQINEFEEYSSFFGSKPKLFNTHTSKSITLPVIEFRSDKFILRIRHNFCDYNVGIVSLFPVDIPYAEFFEAANMEFSWEELELELKKYKNYLAKLGKEPSDLVKIAHLAPNWYSEWSGGVISYDGQFGPEAKLIRQPTPYGQGMGNLPSYYVRGRHAFMVAVYNKIDVFRFWDLMKRLESKDK